MPRNTGFDATTTALILNRDGGCCAKCGRHVTHLERGQAWSIHHRAPRARGGAGVKNTWINSAANGVTLCTPCHEGIESTRKHSYDTGWLVRRNGRTLPADIPYLHAIHGYGNALDNGLFERITHGPS